jgi:hypothetical protein
MNLTNIIRLSTIASFLLAVPYTDDNQPQQSNNMFYCRGQYNNQRYSGQLVAGEGCYVDDNLNAATIRLENYQVLVNN